MYLIQDYYESLDTTDIKPITPVITIKTDEELFSQMYKEHFQKNHQQIAANFISEVQKAIELHQAASEEPSQIQRILTLRVLDKDKSALHLDTIVDFNGIEIDLTTGNVTSNPDRQEISAIVDLGKGNRISSKHSASITIDQRFPNYIRVKRGFNSLIAMMDTIRLASSMVTAQQIADNAEPHQIILSQLASTQENPDFIDIQDELLDIAYDAIVEMNYEISPRQALLLASASHYANSEYNMSLKEIAPNERYVLSNTIDIDKEQLKDNDDDIFGAAKEVIENQVAKFEDSRLQSLGM